MEERFYQFLRGHHVLHLATLGEQGLWCAPLFYALDEERIEFVVASDPKTRHTQGALQEPRIAGSVALETKSVGLIQGLQFEGIWKSEDPKARELYFKTFPLARALFPVLWRIEILHAKLTDNRLGFGKKLKFFRENHSL